MGFGRITVAKFEDVSGTLPRDKSEARKVISKHKTTSQVLEANAKWGRKNSATRPIATRGVIGILIAAFCFLVGKVQAQDSTMAQKPNVGIYITVKYSKKCEHQVVNFDNKKFCLAAQPVLTLDDLSSISTIKIDLANQSYFSLVFTPIGVSKLKNLSIAFPNTQIVLVVDKLIVGFLTDLQTLRSNSLKMTAGTGSAENVQFVHDKLKTLLPVRN